MDVRIDETWEDVLACRIDHLGIRWRFEVRADASDRLAFHQVAAQQGRELREQLVADVVAGGVVDDLELVQVEVEQRRGRPALVDALDRQVEPAPEERTNLETPAWSRRAVAGFGRPPVPVMNENLDVPTFMRKHAE